MRTRFLVLAVAIGFSLPVLIHADDNVRDVQEKLRDGGFYHGESDGAYSSQLSEALTRYQVRKGLPITGQLDEETSKALGAKPAVGPGTSATEQSSSDTWRRLRKGERRTSTSARQSETAATDGQETSSARRDEAAETSTETRTRSVPSATARASDEVTESRSAPAATVATSSGVRERVSTPQATPRISADTTEAASAPPTSARASAETEETQSAPAAPAAISSGIKESVSVRSATARTSSEPTEQRLATTATISMDRLRDYVAAFVLAGLDKDVGAEAEFFADRVDYYDGGLMDREKIRQDLKRYDKQWPERHFWIAGNITVEPQSDNRVRVTFPLGFKLRSGNKTFSGKVDKSLVLEAAGNDLQIVAVKERED